MNTNTELNPVFSNAEFQRMCDEIYSGSYDFEYDKSLLLSLMSKYDPYEETGGADPDDPAGVESYCWQSFYDDYSADIQGYIRETYSDPLFVLG